MRVRRILNSLPKYRKNVDVLAEDFFVELHECSGRCWLTRHALRRSQYLPRMVCCFPISKCLHGDFQDGKWQDLIRVVVGHRRFDRDFRIRIRINVIREFHFVEDRAVIDVLHGIPRYIEVPPGPFDPYAIEIDRVRQNHHGFRRQIFRILMKRRIHNGYHV